MTTRQRPRNHPLSKSKLGNLWLYALLNYETHKILITSFLQNSPHGQTAEGSLKSERVYIHGYT